MHIRKTRNICREFFSNSRYPCDPNTTPSPSSGADPNATPSPSSDAYPNATPPPSSLAPSSATPTVGAVPKAGTGSAKTRATEDSFEKNYQVRMLTTWMHPFFCYLNQLTTLPRSKAWRGETLLSRTVVRLDITVAHDTKHALLLAHDCPCSLYPQTLCSQRTEICCIPGTQQMELKAFRLRRCHMTQSILRIATLRMGCRS